MLEKLIRFFTDPRYRFLVHCSLGLHKHMDDEEYLRRVFYARMGTQLNFEDPQTFNEKLQWLKLHDRDPAYVEMVDKAAVKRYVAGKLGNAYIIPTLGVYDRPRNIDFDALPDRFVLKCTHDSGGVVICRDKSAFDRRRAVRTLDRFWKRDYYSQWREWPYQFVPKRVIAEEYLEAETGGLADYKIHCFNGEPRLILVCQDRFSDSGMSEDFFSESWEHLAVKRPNVRQAAAPIEKPAQLGEMLALAKTLAKDIPFVRVDVYVVRGRIYFSELTLYPAAGLTPFEPAQWDETFGGWLDLSAVRTH